MPCDRPIHQVCRLLYLMVSLILIYRVKTETLKKEVSKVKDKIHHKKLSSLSKILGSKQNFESNISSKIFEHVLSRRKFWKLILQKIRIRPKMIFRCHFNAIQDRGRHVRNTETQVNFAKVGFPKVGSKVFHFFVPTPASAEEPIKIHFFIYGGVMLPISVAFLVIICMGLRWVFSFFLKQLLRTILP